MHFLRLKDQLLLRVAGNLEHASEILALAKTNKRLYHTLRPNLYEFNVQQQNSSALMWSAKNDRSELAKALIREFKADVNAIHEGGTPLILAAKLGSESVVRVLLSVPEINLNARNHNQETALWCAANKGKTAVVEGLLKEENIELDCHDAACGLTPLAAATMNGHTMITRRLRDTGKVDINKQDKLGWTPAFHALWYKRYDILRDLLAESALDHTHRDKQGRDLLRVANEWDRVEAVWGLVTSNVSSVVDQEGRE
ncbi:ankyrin repeat domain-containing protein [Aspergillus stella-maris]|uniref:ankyrin repeat domain-containing protein n=1 Tax=Aspergillus stella-maris TaxID=1810926 RepID=UPI003CCCEC17